MDGQDAVLVPSSYDGEIQLQKALMEDLFNLEVNTVYQLNWENNEDKSSMLKELEDGKLYSFVFNYRADYEGADAIVLSNQNDVFILVGRSLSFEFLQNKSVAPAIEIDLTDQDDEIDFAML